MKRNRKKENDDRIMRDVGLALETTIRFKLGIMKTIRIRRQLTSPIEMWTSTLFTFIYDESDT
jgi:hypothetical protein